MVFVENPPVSPPPIVTECLAPESKNIPTLDQTNLATLQPMLLDNARWGGILRVMCYTLREECPLKLEGELYNKCSPYTCG